MDSKTETVSDREIARFMNINLTFSFGMFWVVDEEGEMPDYGDGTVYSPSTNWNQLMPVVEKINGMGFDALILCNGIHTEKHSCDITTTGDVYAATTSKSLIETIYKAVVEFIRWFNSQSHDTIK